MSVHDETTDISKKSQMSISLRYDYNNSIREDFFCFVDCYDSEDEDCAISESIVSGQQIAKIVKNNLQKHGFDLNDCVGISTDGCAVMTSEAKGALSNLKLSLVNATYCPCYSHALNLSISKSSKYKSIQISVVIVKEIISFLDGSAKRYKTVKRFMKSKLKSLFETRWVECHESVDRFCQSFGDIIKILNNGGIHMLPIRKNVIEKSFRHKISGVNLCFAEPVNRNTQNQHSTANEKSCKNCC